MRSLCVILFTASAIWAQEPAPAQSTPVVSVSTPPLASADLDSPYASPRDAARHWLQATLSGLREQHDIRAGLRGFAQALIADRSYAPAAFNLGVLSAVAGKWDDGVAALEEAARLDPAGLGARTKPQLERLRLIASLERTPEGRRKRRYDETLLGLLPALAKTAPGDAVLELAELGRIDPNRWEAPALLAGLEGNGTGYDVAAKFLEIAAKNATDPAMKSRLEAALAAAQREVKYATARYQAETAAENGKYSEAAEYYETAWTVEPARTVNAVDAVSARLLTDDTAHASTLLLRLQASGDPEFTTIANAMIKELQTIEPAAKSPAPDSAGFYRDRGSVQPVHIADLVPKVDAGPLEIYARPLPKLVDDPEPVMLLASLSADVSAASQSPQLPALGAPAIAGDRPWSELAPLLQHSTTDAGVKPARATQAADLTQGPRNRRVLLMTSEPAGARIFAGDRPEAICEAPCSIQIADGTHPFRLSLAGYQDQTQTVKITGADREILVPLTAIRGSVIVETPTPAPLKVNGAPTMASSPAELSLVPGVYRIQAEMGSVVRERVITVKPGARLRLQFQP